MASSSPSAEERTVTLMSLDGELFEIEESVAMESGQIKYLIEDNCTAQIVPVPNVMGNTLAKVIEYFRIHADKTYTEEELKDWDDEYINVDLDTLHDLILAANYLEAKGLLDLCCQTVGDMIKGKTPQQIRETFNIVNDFTPEQEEEIRREYAWAFEDSLDLL